MSRPITSTRDWLASDTWLATATAVLLTLVLGIVSLVLLPFVWGACRLFDAVHAGRNQPSSQRNERRALLAVAGMFLLLAAATGWSPVSFLAAPLVLFGVGLGVHAIWGAR